MKIAVLVKQVFDTEVRIKLSSDGKSFDQSDVKWVVSPYDEFAIEQALKVKEKTQGEVVVISAAPPRVVEAMRTALAMGADRGVRIDTDGVEMDAYTTSVVLAKVITEEGFDIVFGGKQAIDDDSSQVLQGVAELTNMACVLPIDMFELSADAKSAIVERAVAGGTTQVIHVEFPAVLGCDKGLNEPRYASLPGIMKAKSKKIEEKKASDLLEGVTALVQTLSVELPPERSAGKIIEGAPEEVADQLIRYLREEAKVI